MRITIAEGETATWNVDTGVLDHGGADGGVDTETITPETIAQADGAPAISVFSVKSFTIEDNAALTLVGTNAVAILSAEDIVIDGLLDVSGTGVTGGPGGESASEWSPTEQPIAAHSGRHGRYDYKEGAGTAAAGSGGGGGSNATAGGAAGAAATTAFAVVASISGSAAGEPLGAEFLRGGGAGGATTWNNTFASKLGGGGGGGALLLAAAAAVRVNARGAIDAGGAGAEPPTGTPPAGALGPGSGGGAGGTVLLEAPVVVVTGGIYANGGGGCGGDAENDDLPTAGEDGTLSTLPARGSSAVGDRDVYAVSRGGNGAAGTLAATAGGDAQGSTAADFGQAASGGGGGGAGRIAILTLTGEIEGDGEISPSSAATYDVAKLVPLD